MGYLLEQTYYHTFQCSNRIRKFYKVNHIDNESCNNQRISNNQQQSKSHQITRPSSERVIYKHINKEELQLRRSGVSGRVHRTYSSVEISHPIIAASNHQRTNNLVISKNCGYFFHMKYLDVVALATIQFNQNFFNVLHDPIASGCVLKIKFCLHCSSGRNKLMRESQSTFFFFF